MKNSKNTTAKKSVAKKSVAARKVKGVEEMTVKQALKLINKGQRMLHHSGRVLHAYYLNKFADHNKVIEVKMLNSNA